jgi:hypothetical protein
VAHDKHNELGDLPDGFDEHAQPCAGIGTIAERQRTGAAGESSRVRAGRVRGVGVDLPNRSSIRPRSRPDAAIAASAFVTSSGIICARSILPCAKFSRK